MKIRYAGFIVERTSPSRVSLRQAIGGIKSNGNPYYRTIGNYPGYAGAINELLSRLAENGQSISEVEQHWEAFANHLEKIHTIASELKLVVESAA